MSGTEQVIVALGSNLGHPERTIRNAAQALRAFADGPVRLSSLWRTSPVDCPPGSPPFLNAVAIFASHSKETPQSLLRNLQRIESAFGRKPKTILNEPRVLDLDLIAFGGRQINNEELILPHPRAHLRKFVLAPLAELAPDLVMPGQTQTVTEILRGLQSSETISRIEPESNLL